jgi:formylglycine-generating enzyme required for sulfatase activity
MEFVQIQPGEFTMGCSPGDSQCMDDESPAHRVHITKAFQIGRYEVTQQQWAVVMGSSPSSFKGVALPVETVSWDDAQQFLGWLNARDDGFRYRLPTEAEWEYAARAGTTDRYAGADALGDVAWYGDNSGSTTHPVGQKRQNAWGVYDMLGNLQEWCQDWYGTSYYSSSPVENPAGPSSGQNRILRGGSFYGSARYVRVSIRVSNVPGYRHVSIGFRVVRELAASSCPGPVITTQPAGKTIAAGSTVDLSVTASGSAPLSYQWYEGASGNTTKPVGTNSATFRTPALTVATTYWVRVTNPCGQADSATATVSIATSAGLNMEFVQLQPGEFTMGCSPGDSECDPDESPAHRVRITKAFQIGKYEVTQEQWQAVMGSNPSYSKGATLPVEMVSWDDTQQFLGRVNARNDGYRYRLPTEAEWEYTARAGATDKYAGGVLNEIAWFGDNSSSKTHPVGEKKPNAWGLYDMLGNVWEWCQDWYSSNYYSSSPAADPPGPLNGSNRLLRGGSKDAYSGFLSVSFRGSSSPGSRYDYNGFRCVREPIP